MTKAASELLVSRMDADERSAPRDSKPESAELSAMYLRHQAELRQLTARMGLGAADADDVLQDVYMELLRRPGEYRGPEEGRRWLTRVTVNRCILEFRRRRRLERKASDIRARQVPAGAALNTPDANAALAEQRERVRQCLGQLEETLLVPMVLRYFHEYTSEEIGELLDLPAGTVRSRLHEGRLILAQRMAEGVDRP